MRQMREFPTLKNTVQCTVPIVVPKMCTVKQSYNTHSNSQYLVSPSLLPLVQMGVLSTGLHKWVPKRYYLRYVLYSIFGFKQQQNTDCSSLKDCQHFWWSVHILLGKLKTLET